MASDDHPTNPRFVNLLGLAGTTLRDFTLGEIIGQGGFGVVYEATRGGVTYALKLPLIDSSDEKRRAQALAELPRIKKEAAALQSLSHPNIVELAEYFTWSPVKQTVGDADGLPLLVMRFVDGVPMDRWVRHAHPTLRTILTAYRQVLSALDYCHSHSFFHRDLKPSNILVDSSGKPTLIDFGIAKSKALKTSTEVATWIGTTDFFAPEYLQYPFSRDAVKGLPFAFTPAQDLYALGHTVFLTLTGATAWSAWKSVLSTQPSVAFMAIAQRVDLPLPSALNPAVPPAVDAFVGKLMAREVSLRFQSARPALDSLDSVLRSADPALDAPLVLPTAEECQRRVEEFSVAHAEALDAAAEASADDDDADGIDVSLSSLSSGPGNSRTHVRQQPAAPKPSSAKQTVPLRIPASALPPNQHGTTSPRPSVAASAASPLPSSTAAKRPFGGSRRSTPASEPRPKTAAFQPPSVVEAPAFEDIGPPVVPPPQAPSPTALSPELERLRDEFRDYERPQAKPRGVMLYVVAGAGVLVALLVGAGALSRSSTAPQPSVSLLEPSTDAGVSATVGALDAVYQPPASPPSPAPLTPVPPPAAVPTGAVAAGSGDVKPKPRASADAKAVDDILRREYGGQRPTLGPDGTATAASPSPTGAPTGPAPTGWGTRGVYTQPAAAPSGPRRFGVSIGSELAGTLLKPLDSRIGSMPVVVRLKRAWAPRGEVLLPTGTTFYGSAGTSSGRFTATFSRLKLPDGVEAPLQALAYDAQDKKPGLAPSRRIQTQAAGGPNVGEAVARGAANVALGQVQGGPLADVARGAGQTVVNQTGSPSGAAAQEALLLDAPVDVTIFVSEAF